jgi:hypothetical protein
MKKKQTNRDEAGVQMGEKTLKMVVLLLLLTAVLGSAACSSNRIYLAKSLWADREINIDGKDEEWQGTKAFLEQEQVFLSFLNDQEYLYVALMASQNPTGNQIMRQGLTVWFDPKDGKSKTFGIKFPQGVFPGERPREFGRKRPEDVTENQPSAGNEEIEILKSEKSEPEKIGVDQAKNEGLEVRAAFSNELFVYELKIPLLATPTRPLAIGAQPGAQIGIGIETTAMKQSRPRESGRSEMGGGEMGGRERMGGRPGGSGGGRRRLEMEPDLPKSLKCWLKVRLAQEKTINQPTLLF